MIELPVPLLGFCAWSGTGKTTLLRQLLPLLRQRGLRVGLVKHAHHDFDIDHPGKDSYELRKAGAGQVLVVSRRRMAWIRELDTERDEPGLQEALAALDTDHLDLVLVEGFKHESLPKIELHRPALGRELLATHDADIIAVASDGPVDELPERVIALDLNDPAAIAAFVIDRLMPADSAAGRHAGS